MIITKDYAELANSGVGPRSLASTFLDEYFNRNEVSLPINPFQILTELGIPFVFRPFKNYDGIYIPKENLDDIPVVGINLNRPITRQRFSAAHELCHHLKDAKHGFVCKPNAQSNIEKYAEDFASELLMPTKQFIKIVESFSKDGLINLDDVLKVAHIFGVSFKACLNKIAYQLHMIDGDTSPDGLKKMAKQFCPQNRKKELCLYDTELYEQLLDSVGKNFEVTPTDRACQKFKTEYIYYDSRMEGVEIDIEKVGDIVEDIRRLKQDSEFCNEKNQNIIEVAGLTIVYDYVFEEASSNINIYKIKKINEKLFSTAPYPEFGGQYRQSNTMVIGAKFETIDYRNVANEMIELDKELEEFMKSCDSLSNSRYIEEVIRFHHRLTVIHAFRDGNGRTSRALVNMMLLRKHIPPVFFNDEKKNEYKKALKVADVNKDFNPLFELFYKSILESNARLTDFYI